MTDRVSRIPADLFDLSGRVAIVTGAGRGLGHAFSLYLAAAGADVAAISRDPAGAAATANEVRAMGRRAISIGVDVRDAAAVRAAVDRTVDELGGLAILVNNAGINTGNDTPPEDLPLETWELVLATNLSGYFRFCQAAVRHMARGGGGKMINIASAAATRIPRLPGRHTTAYSVSKAGVVALTRSLGLEWARYGICVNAISPSFTHTGLISRDPVLVQMMRDTSPFARLGEPSDLMGMLLYLASSASNFTTGQDFLVDGGNTL